MSTKRFIRDYKLVIGEGDEAIIIEPPRQIVFDGTLSIRGALGQLNVDVYNLSEKRRLQIAKEPESSKVVNIELSVGYQDSEELVRIFKGTVHEADNSREGDSVITSITCLDGGFDFLNSFSRKTIRGGTDPVRSLLNDMPNTRVGPLTQLDELTRPNVFVGPTADLIRETVGNQADSFWREGTFSVLKENEVMDNFAPLVSAKTGLTNTPERDQSKISFSTVMNPQIKIGRVVKLESVFAPQYDGVYKIETITYSGDYYGNDWSMKCDGFIGPGFVAPENFENA